MTVDLGGRSFLKLDDFTPEEIRYLLDLAAELKAEKAEGTEHPRLAGKNIALIFEKTSTRTRCSFEVASFDQDVRVTYLGPSSGSQIGHKESIKDTARVLGRLVHGAIIRTFAQSDVEEFADYSGIPTINALTDDEHPCQILADLLTIREKLGGWDGRKIAFVGDGCNNIARSWCWAARHLGFSLTIGSPEACQPPADFLGRLDTSNITITSDPAEAVADADVVNTDVWLSMGQERQTGKEAQFGSYQVNSALLQGAAPNHIVLHCLPAYRGKEISEDVLEQHADTIFQQAENRLHIQKGIMARMAKHRVL